MKYPGWFPYPQSWLRAAILFLSLIPTAYLWWIFDPILEVPARLYARRSPVAWELALEILTYWFLILGVLAPTLINVLIDRWIWNKPSPKQRFFRWFPGWNSWLEGIYSWLGFLVMFLLVFVFDFIDTNGWEDVWDIEKRIQGLMGIVFILCAYWFQLRHQFLAEVLDLRTRLAKGEARYQRRFTGKTRLNKKVKPPVDPIDAELEEMRRELRRKMKKKE